MNTVLGIDLGTQNIKVVFYDFDARETVAVKSAPLDLHQSDDGLAEQQAHWWILALEQALKEVDKDVRGSVRGLAVSGQQHGFVPHVLYVGDTCRQNLTFSKTNKMMANQNRSAARGIA